MANKKKINLKPEWFTILVKIDTWRTDLSFDLKENDGKPTIYDQIMLTGQIIYTSYDGVFIKTGMPIQITLIAKDKEIDPMAGWFDKESGYFVREIDDNLRRLREYNYTFGWFDKFEGTLGATIYSLPRAITNRLILLLSHLNTVHLDITGIYRGRIRPAIQSIAVKSQADLSDYL